jgi:glutamate-ammonia-ligase adenylyltransferase
LAPVFAASPYLFGLARRWPDLLRDLLADGPDERLGRVLAATEALAGGADDLRAPLRRLKAELHLLTALADLGGVWNLDQVTGALSRFADVSVNAALRAVAHDQRERGKLVSAADDPRGPVPGLFGLAMGKHGAFELNYSSDIDISLFWDPDALIPALAEGVEPQRFVRLDNSRTEAGSGLGLSLVGAVLEAHGGRVQLDEGPGEYGGFGPGLRVALVLPPAETA